MGGYASRTAYEAVRRDEARFIDHATMKLVITEEHVIKDAPTGRAPFIITPRARDRPLNLRRFGLVP